MHALAIAGVTAILRDVLERGMLDHGVGEVLGQDVTVTAMAPDRIRLEGADARPRLNVFLHQVTTNPAWRNVGLPPRPRDAHRSGTQPQALDLQYLVTAYGTGDLHTEVLLGYAMQCLQDNAALTPERIRLALDPPTPPAIGTAWPSVYRALGAADLAERYVQLTITSVPMTTEELSKLWAALKAHYRPTAPYQVSVVVGEPARVARAPGALERG